MEGFPSILESIGDLRKDQIDQLMQRARWDLTPYAGAGMFIKIVDKSTTGWGHITVDNFQFDAEVLTEYPEIDD